MKVLKCTLVRSGQDVRKFQVFNLLFFVIFSYSKDNRIKIGEQPYACSPSDSIGRFSLSHIFILSSASFAAF